MSINQTPTGIVLKNFSDASKAAWKDFKEIKLKYKKIEDFTGNHALVSTVALIFFTAITLIGVLFLASSLGQFLKTSFEISKGATKNINAKIISIIANTILGLTGTLSIIPTLTLGIAAYNKGGFSKELKKDIKLLSKEDGHLNKNPIEKTWKNGKKLVKKELKKTKTTLNNLGNKIKNFNIKNLF